MSPSPLTLVDKIVVLHEALDRAELAHAFGGALALAWCTERARGTIDIDVNVFVAAERSEAVFAALPAGVVRNADDLDRCRRDGQVRLWWDATPVDLFTNTTEFHDAAAARAVVHDFASTRVPFLSCTDVAVFKVFFDRPKDVVDVDEMLAVGALDVDTVLGVLVRYLGADDDRVRRLADRTRPTRR